MLQRLFLVFPLRGFLLPPFANWTFCEPFCFRLLKFAQPFLQSGLAQTAIHRTGLADNITGLENQPVAPGLQAQAVFIQHAVKLVPGLGGFQLFQTVTLDEPYQALQIAGMFHPGGCRFTRFTPGIVIDCLKTVSLLDLLRSFTQGGEVVVRRVAGKALGMNFVDGDMEMQVVGIGVQHSNPLVFTVAQGLTDF